MTVHSTTRAPFWQSAPPQSQPSNIPVIWPGVHAPVRGIILCARPEGCFTHPITEQGKFRTLPCVGRKNGCQICGPATRLRWQGYVPIFLERCGRIAIAQVTKEAARNCRPLFDRREILRGRILVLTRCGEDKQSRVTAEVHAQRDATDLPPCPNVREALLHLWGLSPEMRRFEQEEEVSHE